MAQITSKMLAERFEIRISTLKRWARDLLPSNPATGLRKGLARCYSLNEAFEVVLGGGLISGLGFSVSEARTIVSDLRDWLFLKGLYPDVLGFSLSEMDCGVKNYSIDIYKFTPPEIGFVYQAEGFIDIVELEKRGISKLVRREYVSELIFNNLGDFQKQQRMVAELPISGILDNFLLQMDGCYKPQNIRNFISIGCKSIYARSPFRKNKDRTNAH